MEIAGKQYQFKYLSADVFIKARKPLRVVDEAIKKLAALEESEGEEALAGQFSAAWRQFCDMVFEGEKPYDASISDIIAVAADFFGQAVGGVKK